MYLPTYGFKTIGLGVFNQMLVRLYRKEWEHDYQKYSTVFFPVQSKIHTTRNPARLDRALYAYCKRRDECLELVTLTTLGTVFSPEQLKSLYTK